MKNFQLIIFDWDGTLIDSEARIVNCMHAAIADMDLPVRTDDQIRNIIGLGLQEALSTLFPDQEPHIHQGLVERYRHHFLIQDQTPSALFDGVEDMLENLRERGHYLAIATGKGRMGLDKSLDETGIGDFFDFTRCADETRSKPHPQMLEEIMDRLGVMPQETLMVGDTEYDLQMANNAGTSALGVSYGVHDKQRLIACEPLACVDNVGQLHGWLTNEHKV